MEKKFIKTKTQSGNPVRIHTRILSTGLVYIDKYVYSNQPLQYFEEVNGFPKRFGRTLYRQEIVFNQETMKALPIILDLYDNPFKTPSIPPQPNESEPMADKNN